MDYEELKRKLAARLEREPDPRASLRSVLGHGAGPSPDRAPAAAELRDVAVVGIHCRVPGGDTPDEYLDALLRGGSYLDDSIGSRWPDGSIDGLAPLRVGSIRGALDFDPQRFRISPREAEAMDPHHRVTLESVWSCIEDAGHAPADLARTRTGVFVAVYNPDFGLCGRTSAWEPESRIYLGTGSAHSLLPNRVSYLFDLRGPSEVVDTACSSSLVAVHRAVQAIASDECEQAIVSGVSLLLDPARLVGLGRLGILSPDGRCAPFDAGSTGQVMGEGVVTVLLRRASQARVDGDHLYGIIRASGVNHRGRGAGGLIRPDVESQVALIDRVYGGAGIEPSEVAYIEAHGNGGNGDEAELRAFEQRFSPGTWIGSAKASIGCLEAAGGLAALVKVLLAMARGTMPATFGHTTPPLLDGAAPRCSVLTEHRPVDELARPGRPLRIAVHAHGLGGVNAHLVVERATAVERDPDPGGWVPMLCAGQTDALLTQAVGELRAALDRTPPPGLTDVAFTLAVGREHGPVRACVVARSLEQAKRSLDGLLERGEDDPSSWAELAPRLRQDLEHWRAGGAVRWHDHFQSGRRIRLPVSPLRRQSFPIPPAEPPAALGELPGREHHDARSSTLVDVLREWLARQCGIEAPQIAADAPLADLGVDSVVYVELCERLERRLALSISPADLARCGTLAEIAACIRGRAAEPGGSSPELEHTVLRRLEARAELDVGEIRSLSARERLFAEQRAALRQQLRPPAAPALAAAVEAHRSCFEVLEDPRGSLWIFIDTNAGNTFDLDALERLLALTEAIGEHADDRTRLLYLTHHGRSFSLGGHRESFVRAVEEGRAASIQRIGEVYGRFLSRLAALPCLTVAVAYGSAQGGGMELLMAMDQQVVWPGVKLGFPEIASGLIAGMGGLSYVASVVGPTRALRMNLDGRLFSSEEALRLGLISHVSSTPFATALELGEPSVRLEAGLAMRRVINRVKVPRLLADVDDWVEFVCGGALLDRAAKIRADWELISRS